MFTVTKIKSFAREDREYERKTKWHFDEYSDAVKKFVEVCEDLNFAALTDFDIEVSLADYSTGEIFKVVDFTNYTH